MPTCKETTKLISDSLERSLSFRERTQLWLHMAICGLCRRFRSDVVALRQMVRIISKNELTTPSELAPQSDQATELSTDAKMRIQARINEHQH